MGRLIPFPGGTEGVCPLGGSRVATGGKQRQGRRFSFERSENKRTRLSSDNRVPKNGGYLLSQLVGQYHRRW